MKYTLAVLIALSTLALNINVASAGPDNLCGIADVGICPPPFPF
jgi:hypothetical protein